MTGVVTSLSPAEVGNPSQDARAFRRALGQYPTGITIVTASDGTRHVGVTANSFASVSLDPPLVLWSIDRKSTSLATFMEASHFAINILSDAQTALSTRFSRSSEEKFQGVDWHAGHGNAPLLAGAVVHLQCRREQEYDGGDHVIMVGRVEQYARYEADPLLFAKGRYAIAVDAPVAPATRAGGDPASQGGDADEPTLLQSLLRAYEGISAKLHTHRETEGLTLNQSRALALLARGRAESIAHVMRDALLGQSAAEDSIANLVERKLATADAEGGFSITPLGRETSVRLRRKVREIEAQLVARISELDMSGVGKMVTALAKAAQE